MIQKFKDYFSQKSEEVYNCQSCGDELNNETPVFVIDGKIFHNNVDCLFEYTNKTGRKITGRSPLNLKDAIKKLKYN
jgi:hypothetical protein